MDVTSLWLIIMMSSLAFTKPAEGLPKGRPTFNCAMISGTYFPNYCFMKDGLHVKWAGRGKGSQYVIAWVRNRLWVTLSVNGGGGGKGEEGQVYQMNIWGWKKNFGGRFFASQDHNIYSLLTKNYHKGGGGREWSRGTHVFPHPPNNALSNPQCDGCIEQFWGIYKRKLRFDFLPR